MTGVDQPDFDAVADGEDEDSYFDGPYLVFTEAYHRRRGYCCQSNCRHCPYGFGKPAAALVAPEEK